MIILGSGLAGCLASALIPGSKIYEPLSQSPTHKAILRFRTPLIGKALGIPFKQVRVYKGIWHHDHPVEFSPRYAILYARKVNDFISDRSICNLDSVDRWIAPDNFQEKLLSMANVTYNSDIKYFIKTKETLISTLPINFTIDFLSEKIFKPKIDIRVSSIYVTSCIIPDCDIYMTYYYTGNDTSIYRASLSGNELIVESSFPISSDDITMVINSFGLTGIKNLKYKNLNFEQKNGKIVPIDEHYRQEFIYNITNNYNIWSLGRFATWRNIVMDDIYKDILFIKEKTTMSNYDRIRGQK